ncbi:MAG: V-type ATP synthase subunit D [Deltaproteobacteria bacterium]|nr:V-type ATP synthase subunit D [Deltaproteobacteria bacterium]
MAKLRLNKNTLRDRSEQLRLYLEFLPTLELRKRQLQMARDRVRAEQARHEHEVQALRRHAEPWAPLLGRLHAAARPFAAVETTVVRTGTIAGVAVPVFERVEFGPAQYSLLATPPAFDDTVDLLRQVASLRVRLDVLQTQRERLDRELQRTTQRINLYEKVLIPGARADMRRLRVYLGDQQTAAVCRAKIAKAKLLVAATKRRQEQPWPS